MKRFFILISIMIALLPAMALAACPADKVCLENPLAAIGVNSPGDLVVRAIQLFSAIIGTAAIMFIVFSAFKLVIASNEESIKEARGSITWSVAGFCVAILSFTIVSGAAKLLGFNPGIVSDNLVKDTIDSPLTGPADPRFFWSMVNFVMVNILGLIGIVTILMIIYYGYRYITSAGNEESVEQAKTGLKWAIIGFVIAILSFTIISGVQKLLFSGAGA